MFLDAHTFHIQVWRSGVFPRCRKSCSMVFICSLRCKFMLLCNIFLKEIWALVSCDVIEILISLYCPKDIKYKKIRLFLNMQRKNVHKKCISQANKVHSINPRTYKQSYTPTVVQGRGGGKWNPFSEFLLCLNNS